MKLKNTSTWPTIFVRRIITYGCRKWGHQVKRLTEAKIRGSDYDHQYSGRAYLYEQRFVATMGAKLKPQAAAHLIIHEVGHLAVYWKERYDGQRKDRRNGKGWGGSEEYIERLTKKFVAEIEPMLADWYSDAVNDVVEKPPVQKLSAPQRRALSALRGVERWRDKQRKAEAAQRKAGRRIKEYEKKVRYYERTLEAMPSICGQVPSRG